MAARPHGLPPTQRIKKRVEFLRIQDSPARVGTKHLLVLLAARVDRRGPAGGPDVSASFVGDGDDAARRPPRLGVVASRKVGNAVARNRCKRLVREAFRLHQAMLPRDVDLVIIVRPGTHELALADVADEVVRAVPLIAKRARELSRSRSSAGHSSPRLNGSQG